MTWVSVEEIGALWYKGQCTPMNKIIPNRQDSTGAGWTSNLRQYTSHKWSAAGNSLGTTVVSPIYKRPPRQRPVKYRGDYRCPFWLTIVSLSQKPLSRYYHYRGILSWYYHDTIRFWSGRESWLLCIICLPGVSWWLSGSSSRCHRDRVVCSLWLW